jgi:hypothetical protein
MNSYVIYSHNSLIYLNRSYGEPKTIMIKRCDFLEKKDIEMFLMLTVN